MPFAKQELKSGAQIVLTDHGGLMYSLACVAKPKPGEQPRSIVAIMTEHEFIDFIEMVGKIAAMSEEGKPKVLL